ncbi:MBL fold metallo-hydrolase [Aquimarina latercula]|uniref:MBL fold metallo-hydrolase n=1 Tax=Aquimarina latercula TaxID=987 RepID=UPI00040B47E1|nr:MBL fold metallo-hydrolase [Aquimarina latercula]
MKIIKKILKILIISIVLIGVVGFATYKIVTNGTEFGGEMDEVSLKKAEKSRQYNIENEHFKNSPNVVSGSMKANWKDMRGGQERVPPGSFPTEKPVISKVLDSSGIKATWFGHATVYIEMDGKRILTDPMLSNKAFPVSMVAPERFNPPPLEVNELPKIDIVTISHDHFDHLDMKTVQVLSKKGTQFFVGIGVKAHLIEWGILESQIHEMDWWETIALDDFKIHCTPARHYSGRKGMDNSTLWTSWIIESTNHKIFHSGDSGYQSHFKEIGDRFGTIDIGFIKIGDYGLDLGWQDIHMHTEKSIQAAKDVNAQLLFPIHWGTFNLSNHDWYEPINLAVEFSNRESVELVTPKIGQTIKFGDEILNEFWWKMLEDLSVQFKTK